MLPLLLLLIGPAAAQLLTLPEAARQAVAASPEVEASRRRAEEAGLEEPVILANLDPRFEGAFGFTDDQAPRAAPAFEGSRARRTVWEAGIAQNTLLGSEAKLAWRNDRLVNPSLFRALDPSVDSRLTLSLRQPLLRYFWGRPDKARRGRARSGVVSAQARLRAVKEQAAGTAARAHAELYYAKRLVEIREAGVADAARLLAKYEEKRRYGIAEPSDLLQAQASLELQELELIGARSQVERARIALAAALRKPSPAGLDAGAPDGLPAPDAAVGDDEQALGRRSDVEAARADRDRLRWSHRVEVLDTLPDLAVTASYGAAGLDTSYGKAWNDLGSFDHAVKTAGVSVSVPFGFARERLSRRVAQLRLDAAEAETKRAESEGRRELADAREALGLAARKLTAARKLAELERRKFAAEEENFRRGRSTTDLLLRFQQDIRRAEIELLRSEIDEALARIDGARAAGRLLESLGIR